MCTHRAHTQARTRDRKKDLIRPHAHTHYSHTCMHACTHPHQQRGKHISVRRQKGKHARSHTNMQSCLFAQLCVYACAGISACSPQRARTCTQIALRALTAPCVLDSGCPGEGHAYWLVPSKEFACNAEVCMLVSWSSHPAAGECSTMEFSMGSATDSMGAGLSLEPVVGNCDIIHTRPVQKSSHKQKRIKEKR